MNRVNYDCMCVHRVQMMRNYWATFVDDAAEEDLVTLQNERVYKQPIASGKRRRLKQALNVNSSSVLSEDASDCVLPQAGDELILILEKMKVKGGKEGAEDQKWTYMLPNFLEGGSGNQHSVKMVFPFDSPEHLRNREDGTHDIWQLVPSLSSMSNRSCWERKGFWRLGMVYH